MPFRVIADRHLVRSAWKNGGGVTAQLAVSPENAGLDAFDWRLSMAELETEAPFSRFDGIDRTLVLLDGRSLVLEVDGTAHRLDAGRPIFRFAGEAATAARLPQGPVRDFNVMTRRGGFDHRAAFAGPGSILVPAGAAAVAALALEPDTRIGDASQMAELDRFDAILGDDRLAGLTADRRVLLVTIVRVGSDARPDV